MLLANNCEILPVPDEGAGELIPVTTGRDQVKLIGAVRLVGV